MKLHYAEGNPADFEIQEEEEEPKSKKRKGPPKYWDEFIKARYENGRKKVINTNSRTKDRYKQVTMQTLFNSDEAFKKRVMEEYAEWVKKRNEKPESKSEDSKSEDEESGKKKKKKSEPEISNRSLSMTFRKFPDAERLQLGTDFLPNASSEDLCNLFALPFAQRSGSIQLEQNASDSYEFIGIYGDNYKEEVGNYSISVSNAPGIKYMSRAIIQGDDGPYLYMDTLNLHEDAPPGLGTRIFAASVFGAQKLGIKKVKCLAFRAGWDSRWIGYKVWPKMGYDGKIPGTVKLTPTIEHNLQEAGFKKPYRVSHLYMIEGGQEFWEEQGKSFDAEFDTTPGSQSMRVLEAYLRKRMAAEGHSSLEEWMYAGMDDGKKASLMRVAMRYLIHQRYNL